MFFSSTRSFPVFVVEIWHFWFNAISFALSHEEAVGGIFK